MTDTEKELKKSLPFVNQVIAWLSSQRTPTVTLLQLSNGTRHSPGEIIKLFELFGVQPISWLFPSDFEISTIVESLGRHEMAARANR
jgi:hypothetical protein